ncbi:C4-dicarboxylate TRAP transporter substrate-binding protein [Sneathiella litorea]|uniref:C4-dicarboxylate TRAP transporter substrate-binding protein n=1 Tax=Sneathiella litorea TaxID=2606216 RepID=UPI001371061E|nr:C4-dicarboxylate TRAP transporter substrate-binding protein [Sneathiella litorea]
MKLKRMIGKSLFVMAALLSVSAFSTSAYAEYYLRYSELGPPRGARAESLKWWASEIEERTNGEVKIEFFWSQALSKGKETLRAVSTGLADAGTIMGPYNPAEMPVWNYGNIPFVAGDIWVTLRTWQDLQTTMPELSDEMKRNGIHALANFTTGPSEIVSNFEIKSSADLDGKKIRATAGFIPLLKNLGAIPVNLGHSEIYQAMDRGTVDAGATYMFATRSYKFYEVADYVTEVNMGQVVGYGAGINLKLWNEMPDNIKKIMTEVSEEFVEHYSKALIEDNASARAELLKGIDGKVMKITTLDEEERAKWRAAAEELVVEWKERTDAKGIDSQSVIDQYNATFAKYQKELEEKGYPWNR